MSLLTDFHFLRPALLLLIIPAALLCWMLARTILSNGRLQKVIDPELLPHLLLRGGEKRPWLFALIFALLTAMIIALAGPTWRKLPTPVYSNQDALVILLDLSPSMRATDLAPNRLTRARLKILDILKQRTDGLTALVAYAGEAHVVTPLTDDTATIANLVPPLSPRIMPVPGSNIEMAVETGVRLIQDGANGNGQLLAVTDGIAQEALGTIRDTLAGTSVPLSILAVGSGEGSPIPKTNGSGFITDDTGAIVITNFDRNTLEKLAHSTGGRFARISVDDSDIEHLLPENAQAKEAELTEREFDQWREEGPWLVLLILPFALLLFRRGTLAGMGPTAIIPACALTSALLLTPSGDAQASVWQDLWHTKDQQAQQLLEQGEPEQAAEVFENSQWRGTAQYRAGEFDAAAKDFAKSPSAQGLYNLGNSLTQQQRYEEAIQAYDEALQKNPLFADAEHNRDIAKKLKELQQQQQSQQQSQQGDNQQNEQQQDQQDQDQQQSQQNDDQQQQNGGQQDQQTSDANGQQQPESQNQQEQSAEQEEQKDSDQGEEEEQREANENKPEPASDGEQQQQTAGAEDSPLDPETQQALDQWLRQIPDDPSGLMREKFKYESLQRRRAYRAGEWQPPENGATQRW